MRTNSAVAEVDDEEGKKGRGKTTTTGRVGDGTRFDYLVNTHEAVTL